MEAPLFSTLRRATGNGHFPAWGICAIASEPHVNSFRGLRSCRGLDQVLLPRKHVLIVRIMKRVVIADDLADQRALYVTPLVCAGFAVDEAADGGQVIDIVAAQRPDVVVLDLAMPVLDGLEVCRRLTGNDRTAAIPIIVLTGHTLPGVREAVERAGALAFLAKPCAPETLVAVVQQVTESARAVLHQGHSPC